MFPRKVAGAIALAGLVSLAVPAFAQSQTPSAPWPKEPGVPSQIGNIWNGLAHQPTEAEVRAREQQSGIEPSNQQQNKLNDDVEELAKQLLNNHVDTNIPSATGR
jgi:hypothetical protein